MNLQISVGWYLLGMCKNTFLKISCFARPWRLRQREKIFLRSSIKVINDYFKENGIGWYSDWWCQGHDWKPNLDWSGLEPKVPIVHFTNKHWRARKKMPESLKIALSQVRTSSWKVFIFERQLQKVTYLADIFSCLNKINSSMQKVPHTS